MSCEGESPELDTWLTSKGLGEYYQGLRESGVTKSEELIEFTEQDLKEIGDELKMPKLIRRRFIRAVDSIMPNLEEVKTTTPDSSILIPMGPEEHEALQQLGDRLNVLRQEVDGTEEISSSIKTQANKCKKEIKKKFKIVETELTKQKREALAFIDREVEKALKIIQQGEEQSLETSEFCNAANKRCMDALKIKKFSELSSRREKILAIVNEALERETVRLSISAPLEAKFLELFQKIQNGEKIVTVSPIQIEDENECDFASATFTTLGASGQTGPTDVGTSYNGQDHEGQVELVNGIQKWKVPRTGTFEFDASGAQGGQGDGKVGGKGARICSQFKLKKGDTLSILIGQKGGEGNKQYNSSGGGGGGGTFVTSNDTPLLIVAGGNGGSYSAWKTNAPCGRSRHGDQGEYKRDNNISTNGRGWRGGSFQKTDDVASRSEFLKYTGKCFRDGGIGGEKDPHYGGWGGFGGGGGSQFEGGGGGGYFGGVVVNNGQCNKSYPNYSATSYVDKSGKVVTATDGCQGGDGILKIKFISK